jgi:hypothetical protein
MKIRKKQSMGGLLYFMFFIFFLMFLWTFSAEVTMQDGGSKIIFQILFAIITFSILFLGLYTVRGELELTETNLIIKPPFGAKKQIALNDIISLEYKRPPTITFLVTRNINQYFYKFVVTTNNDIYSITLFFGYRDYRKFMDEIEKQTSKQVKGKEIANSFL